MFSTIFRSRSAKQTKFQLLENHTEKFRILSNIALCSFEFHILLTLYSKSMLINDATSLMRYFEHFLPKYGDWVPEKMI